LSETRDFDVPNPKNKNSKAIRVLLVVFCLLIICTGVSFYVIYNEIKTDDPSSLFENPHRTFAPQNGGTSPEKYETIEYNGKTYVRNNDIINLLFLGIDSNASREDRHMGYRSDMVLVCAVDTAAKKVTLISLPRDTYTTVYNISADTGEIEKTRQNRVNAAFAFGGGPSHYGYQNAMACVELFLQRECELKNKLDFTLDIPVYLYAGIDMDGIIPVADSVGGIEVTLEYSIPGVGNKGQTVLLKGKKAETYLRDRHHTPGGDLGRAEKEQDFMIRLAKKIKGMGAVDIIVSLYDELQNYVDTNLNTTQMADLAKILMGVDLDEADKYIIPGKGDTLNGAYYYMPDEQATLELLLKVYYKETA
jgi:LCP family protein required for cell wall assembly